MVTTHRSPAPARSKTVSSTDKRSRTSTRSAQAAAAIPKRAAIYLRQSLDSTGERQAVTRQRKDCAKLCAERGWTVVAVYDDNDISASGRRKRPGFEQMLIDGRNGEFDVIVGWHFDRLTRTLKDLLPLLELATDYKVGSTTVSADIDLTTDVGMMVASILAVVANAEIRRKGVRQSRANEQRAEQGRPSQGGAVPLGFRDEFRTNAHGAEIRHRIVDEASAQVIRQAYGDLQAGRSVSGIARDLNASGYRTIRDTAWSRKAVVELLTNARNAGLREYKDEVIGKAAWDAIVDEGTWRSAVAMLHDPARRNNPHPGGTRKWLGSGLYVCGLCGQRSLAATYRGNNVEGPVRVYICSGPVKHLARRGDVIDDYVVCEVITRLSRKDAARLLVDHDRPDMARLTREAERINARLEALAVEFATDDAITPAMLRKATSTLRARLTEVESKMAHQSRRSVLQDIIGADDVETEWAGYDIDRQRAIIDAISTVTVGKGKIGGPSQKVKRAVAPGSVVVDFIA